MNATTVVAYAYDAALHCLDCTRRGFPSGETSYRLDPYDIDTDSEGNPLGPVFLGDLEDDDCCDDCFVNLLTGDLPAWTAEDPEHYLALTGIDIRPKVSA